MSLSGIGGASGPMSAAQQLGAISSAQWNDYMQTFVPQENLLLQYAMDPNYAAKQMQTAQGLQQQANQQASGIQARQLAQYDTTLTPEQAAAAKKQTGITGALAEVQTANQAKDLAAQTQLGILGAPASGITGQL